MIYAAKRIGLTEKQKKKKKKRIQRRYPELLTPGEKVQIDVKEVPYNCLKGNALRDEKHLYQWTVIDESTRMRFIYGFEEHTPENSVKFLKMLLNKFPFKIQTICYLTRKTRKREIAGKPEFLRQPLGKTPCLNGFKQFLNDDSGIRS